MHVVEMLDELPGEDHVEGAAEREVLRIGQLDVMSLGQQRLDGAGVDVDAHGLGGRLLDEPVQPVGAAIARRATDVED